MPNPAVVLFDVNETLSNLEPLRARFEQVGVPGGLLEVWFASTLRDGFALTVAGDYADFRTVAVGALRSLITPGERPDRDLDAAAEHIVAGFSELGVHSDVADAIELLADAGVRLATLSNGPAELAEGLLERAGLAGVIERFLSVDEVRRWKPSREPYLHAAQQLGVAPEECALIAVHPWDTDGAKRAGLHAGWVNRQSRRYPDAFLAPDVQGDTVVAVAQTLLSGND